MGSALVSAEVVELALLTMTWQLSAASQIPLRWYQCGPGGPRSPIPWGQGRGSRAGGCSRPSWPWRYRRGNTRGY